VALDLYALGRLDDLDALVDLADDPALGVPANAAYLLLARCRIDLRRGKIARARRKAAEAIERFGEADPQGFRPSALAMLVHLSAMSGDRSAARAADDELAAVLVGRGRRVLDHEIARLRAWLPVVEGDLPEARRRLLAAAEGARSAGLHVFEMEARHDALRLGAGAREGQRLADVASRVDGLRAAAIAEHGRAVNSSDPAALEAVVGRFEATGELLVAAEAAAAAARWHREQATTAGAQRCALAAEGLLRRCDGASLLLDVPSTPVALTRRELQVTRMAADGLSSQRIAETLGVSRRTVDNLLGRVYAKLGVTGRRELAQVLSPPEGTGPLGRS
jgi:DNA-binding CsgD family transcriptional regulator